MDTKATLILISGPSGVGKTTIVNKIIASKPDNFHRAITATTRTPRSNEKHGKCYYFWSVDYFMKAVSRNEFLEWKHLYETDYYGTPRQEVEPYLSKNQNVMLTVNIDGIKSLRDKYQRCISIFITPPNINSLYQRLRARNDLSHQQFEKRIQAAINEIELSYMFDHVIVNDELNQAYHELLSYIDAKMNI